MLMRYDDLTLLQVMKNELERLLDGSKRNNVTLSIAFLNSNAFFPAAEVLSATQFNGNDSAIYSSMVISKSSHKN